MADKRLWLCFFVAVIVSVTVASCYAKPAEAGLNCGDRTALLKVLNDQYKEKPRALGLSTTGTAMFEVYTSQTGTWTIIMTTTTGVTCIMAAGHSWEDISDITEGAGEPT